MKSASAPFFWRDVSDCLSEIPTVPEKISSVVLTFAVRMLSGFGQNGCAILTRTLAMAPSIFDSDLSDVGVVWRNIAFRNSEASVSHFHLDAMIGDAQTYSEAESLR